MRFASVIVAVACLVAPAGAQAAIVIDQVYSGPVSDASIIVDKASTERGELRAVLIAPVFTGFSYSGTVTYNGPSYAERGYSFNIQGETQIRFEEGGVTDWKISYTATGHLWSNKPVGATYDLTPGDDDYPGSGNVVANSVAYQDAETLARFLGDGSITFEIANSFDRSVFTGVNAIVNATATASMSAVTVNYVYWVEPPAIPEPTTWAMMIAGFGLVGGAMRQRERRVGPLRATSPRTP